MLHSDCAHHRLLQAVVHGKQCASEQPEKWGRWIEAVLLSATTWEWANH